MIRGVELPPDQVERRRRTAIDQNLGRNLRHGYHGRCWTKDETALLDKLPDGEVAERTGFSVEAVRRKRESLRIPNPTACPGAYGSPPWTEEDDMVLRQLPPEAAALQLGRTIDAVYGRRSLRGLPAVRRGSPYSVRKK